MPRHIYGSRFSCRDDVIGSCHQVTPSASNISGPLGSFDLTEAKAQPAYDAEEQNNISVYKRLKPSVVNITSTAVAFDFFYGQVPQQGQGSGFILDKQGHILTNNHVIDNAQRVEVQLSDKHKYKATVIGVDKAHDLALLQINNAFKSYSGRACRLTRITGRTKGLRHR